MLLFLFCIVALAAGYCLWRLGADSPRRPLGWRAAWQASSIIAAVRITALWLGAAAYQEAAWRQVLGYFLLMLELPEIYGKSRARQPAGVGGALKHHVDGQQPSLGRVANLDSRTITLSSFHFRLIRPLLR
jgi:hypothetical protein